MREDSEFDQLEEVFGVDGMLGRLAKWLRILGFDTIYPCKRPSESHYFVTANKKVRDPRALIAQGSAISEQLRDILEATRLSPRAELVLSRCLICNIPVTEVSKDEVRGRVPARIYETHALFRECANCGRVYWEGSHFERIKMSLHKSGISGIPSCEAEPEQNI